MIVAGSFPVCRVAARVPDRDTLQQLLVARSRDEVALQPPSYGRGLNNLRTFRYCSRCSPAKAAAGPLSSADRAHLHFALSTHRRFVALNCILKQGRVVIKLCWTLEIFPMTELASRREIVHVRMAIALVNETQHDRKRRVPARTSHCGSDFDRTVVDNAYAARRFRTIDGINSDDNQIAARHFAEQRSDGGVSRKSAVPIWLAINLHGAKEPRQSTQKPAEHRPRGHG